MNYRIAGLDPSEFEKFYGLTDAKLAEQGVSRHRVDACPGFPDRVEMRDMEPGEQALLLNFEHLPVNSPYRSRHAIFVREGARETYDQVGVVPDVIKRRLISLRGFDEGGLMIDADVVEGDRVEHLIEKMFANPAISYLHAHYAKRGCFSGRIDRC